MMKTLNTIPKIGFCLLICIGFYSNTHAQIYSSFGVDGGVSISNQILEEKDESKSCILKEKFGFYSGFNGYYGFKSYFGIAGDLAYIQKGTSEELFVNPPSDPNGNGETEMISYRVDVLSFTPSLQFNYPFSSTFQIGLTFGPRVDILMFENSNQFFEDFNPKFTKTATGLSTGLRLNYNLPNFLISVRLSGQYDFTKIASSQLVTLRNRAATFGIGLSYKL